MYLNLSISYTCIKKTEKSYKKNIFKISSPALNKKFELPEVSHSLSDIQDYF